ncbi:MAG: SDR family NAD(P)-dependent oxidoreductase [Pseudomonadota bacterium]|nr:SDR family NAD(P)-dependent oxidoreductase [Pseudomonadota bacterium]
MPAAPDFGCIAITPIGLSSPGIAVAAARAEGIGVLDSQFCQDDSVEKARSNLEELLQQTSSHQAVGLRIAVAPTAWVAGPLLELLTARPHWLILCDWEPASLREHIDTLPAASARRIILEITDSEQLGSLQGESLPVDGVIAKGQESGGWVGEESAFVLTQKLLRSTNLPVFVQGGISIYTAAACRAVGAAGIVVDDGLWLMPESPLPADLQEHIRTSEGQNTVVVGGRGAAALRVLQRPGLAAARTLQELAGRLEVEPDFAARWREEAAAVVGWGSPRERAWPIGQGVGQAAKLRERFKTTGRYVQALIRSSGEIVRLGRQIRCLRPDGPLAASHGTRYPVVQGPMTRVSDTEGFAEAVAAGGGLPVLALALMSADAVEKLLTKTRDRLGTRPWGVGILGFVPLDLRKAQLEVMKNIKPAFALIAGGRPDQAAELEREGIPTYLHVPTPNLARLFIEQGARRFIFEGRECGGHVGPLSSFALWGSAVATLLETVPDQLAPEIHVLFAGGIHDTLSATMVETLAAPLAERGMKVGVLMGTAYLFTREAVATGSITDGFQQQALKCLHTVNLETGPGHASRCAVTPFTEEFFETARQLRAAGKSASEISSALDDLCLGRLRVAAKGLARKGSEIVQVDPDSQLADGMYMIGQVATIRDQIVGIEVLHKSISDDTAYADEDTRLGEALGHGGEGAAARDLEQRRRPDDVAIVGIGTILPKASSPQQFWDHILNKVDAIAEVPPERWDWNLYYDPDPARPDKVYSKWGCFIDDVPFDPIRFGIPPNSLKSIDPVQLLALEAVRRALEDAGYADGDFDRENTSVILGLSGGLGELGERYVARTELTARIDDPSGEVLVGLPEWTEDSFPGILPNVSAGRVANRFDLGGANFTVDSACASSLTAIDVAVSQLETGRCNVAIAGGVDTKLSPFGYMCFSKTPALTPRERPRPFDESADGILLGEGVAVVILKRLEDAERDGDRVYAVIKAAASSSDGKALGLTAPRSSGQVKALERAYQKAGFGAATLGLYEAHGTGTRVGDETEVQTITNTLLAGQAAPKSCAVASVKALIGHTKSTAGAAALIKTALALHHRTLPPQPGVQTPLESLRDPQSPVYLLKEATPWLHHNEHPRRAGVSAFGFGGTNCHCVLEEYRSRLSRVAPGAETWPCEIVLLVAADREGLVREVARLHDGLAGADTPALRDVAYSCALRARAAAADGDFRLALVVEEDTDNLIAALKLVRDHLEEGEFSPLPPYIKLGSGFGTESEKGRGKVAFLFPGQGAQYTGMAREVALFLEPMREALEFADSELRAKLPKHLSQFIYPPGLHSGSEETDANEQLTSTAIAQPAIGAVTLGYLGVLSEMGLTPDMVGGHSYGEYAALHAAGVFSRETFLQLSQVRGKTMAEASSQRGGAMAAVSVAREELEEFLRDTTVVLANHNSPRQSVISGEKDAVEGVMAKMQESGIKARLLPVSGAFHSALMKGSQAPLSRAIEAAEAGLPQVPVFSNITGQPYEPDVGSMRSQLSKHLLSSVEFVEQVTAMYESGARVFLEVGPKGILTGLVDQILQGQPHFAVSVDGSGGGLRGLLIALGALFCHGAGPDFQFLFAGRGCREVAVPDLPRVASPTGTSMQWMVSGGRVKRVDEEEVRISRIRLPGPGSAVEALADNETPAPTGDDAAMSKTHERRRQFADPAAAASSAPAGAPGLPAELPEAGSAVDAYKAYQETMRQFLSMQERIMQQFLAQSPSPQAISTESAAAAPRPKATSGTESQARAPAAEIEAPAEAVVTQAAGPGAVPSGREQLIDKMLTVVSECTGYPPDMLGLDHDLEAELGIDSIKRVEILAGIEKRLPPELAAAMSSGMEAFTQVKTLNGLADTLLERLPPAGTSARQAPVAAAPEPAPAAAPAARELDREQLVAGMIEVVSECTGYPPEMLGLDQDLEAELGIDSIKRVEILAGIEKRLPPELAAAMSSGMDAFTQVKTLNGLANTLLEQLPPAGTSGRQAPVAAAPEPAPAAAPVVQAPDREQLVAGMVEVVSECTGYPPEMLGLDQDLEAELGIDSIKRVEILAGIEKRLPPELTEVMTTRMERLSREKTLNGLAEVLLEVDAAPAAPSPADTQLPENETPSGQLDEASPGRPDRYVMRSRAVPLELRGPEPMEGFVLITEDESSVAASLERRLQEMGVSAARLPREVLQSPERLAEAVDSLRRQHGKVAKLVHLAGLGEHPLPDDLAGWHAVTEVEAKSLFHLTQQCAEDLRQSHGRILAASTLGGAFGRNGRCGPGLPSSGSNSGLLKTLAIEWPEVQVRTIDFDAVTAGEMAVALANELFAGDDETEVGYTKGRRSVLFAVKESVDTRTKSPIEPDATWVVLALGGARGITSEAVRDLIVPGMKLVLVGRSTVSDAEEAPTQDIEDVATLRQLFIDRAREKGETVTPVQVERLIRKLRRERDIRSNLAAFSAAGATVEYHAVDVTDSESFVALIDDVYDRLGRIDAMIQGAGIIEDKLLLDKTRASFDRVFDTKVDSTYLLCRHLRPESLKLVLFFASIAGRTGNRGQADYAAANEVMNRFAWWMREHWPETRVISINWGPWDVMGMASDEVNRQFRERGVIPILPEMGRRFVRDEIRHGDARNVEVVSGIFKSQDEQAEVLPQQPGGAATTGFPMLTELPQPEPNGTVTLSHRLSLNHAMFLDDHRLDGEPVMPAAGALELLAEFVQSVWPDWVVTEIRDLRVLRGLVLDAGAEKTVLLRARPSTHADAEGVEVEAEILDPESQRRFYRVTVVLRSAAPQPVKSRIEPLRSGRSVSVAEIYGEHAFHGPRLRMLKGAKPVNEQGVDSEAVPSRPADWLAGCTDDDRWIFDPGVVDAALQTIIVWARTQLGTYPLPNRFGRIAVFGGIPAGSQLRIYTRVLHYDDKELLFDFRIVDEEGQVLMELDGIAGAHSRALNRLAPSIDEAS